MQAFVLALGVWFVLAGGALACNRPADEAALRAQLLAAVNAERSRAGLERLGADARLDRVAQMVACENAQRRRLAHTGADGSTPGSRVTAAGFVWRMVNENLAQAQGSPGRVVRLWMGSPAHRANILAPQSRQMGAAVASDRNGALYWAMVTAARH